MIVVKCAQLHPKSPLTDPTNRPIVFRICVRLTPCFHVGIPALYLTAVNGECIPKCALTHMSQSNATVFQVMTDCYSLLAR